MLITNLCSLERSCVVTNLANVTCQLPLPSKVTVLPPISSDPGLVPAYQQYVTHTEEPSY